MFPCDREIYGVEVCVRETEKERKETKSRQNLRTSNEIEYFQRFESHFTVSLCCH